MLVLRAANLRLTFILTQTDTQHRHKYRFTHRHRYNCLSLSFIVFHCLSLSFIVFEIKRCVTDATEWVSQWQLSWTAKKHFSMRNILKTFQELLDKLYVSRADGSAVHWWFMMTKHLNSLKIIRWYYPINQIVLDYWKEWKNASSPGWWRSSTDSTQHSRVLKLNPIRLFVIGIKGVQ